LFSSQPAEALLKTPKKSDLDVTSIKPSPPDANASAAAASADAQIIDEATRKKYDEYLQELTAFTLPHIRREPKRLEVRPLHQRHSSSPLAFSRYIIRKIIIFLL